MKAVLKWLRDNSLSITLFALFIAFLLGESFTGWLAFNETLKAYGRSEIGYWSYLVTGNFLDGVFVNWQAAILQLCCLIIFGERLYQKGASHSRKPERRSRKEKKRSQRGTWIYRNSLSIAFVLLFVVSFIGHIIFGSQKYNEQRSLIGQPPVSASSYLLTSEFWFSNTQTWEAEFVAIGLFIVLSIFLRQEKSPESKPVESSDRETGETNK